MKQFYLLLIAACFLNFCAEAQHKQYWSFRNLKEPQLFLTAENTSHAATSLHLAQLVANTTSCQQLFIRFHVWLSNFTSVIMQDDKSFQVKDQIA
jgi:hypothetical protein